VSEPVLSLAINGRERQMNSKLTPFRAPRRAAANGQGGGGALSSVAIVGLGYVGLPTAAALHGACERIVGRCIPCDPHYLLWQLGRDGRTSPLIEQAMRSIMLRPERVVQRAAEILAAEGRALDGSRIIVIGASYKTGVRDLRESPALAIIAGLVRAGADVSYHDPLIPDLRLPGGQQMQAVADPQGADWDLAIVHTQHPGMDLSWASDCPRVLDATYQFDAVPHRTVV
jgi:UDP-N-acetyl-D-glucosamine dehydrogenase